jgi:hypothetical protein
MYLTLSYEVTKILKKGNFDQSCAIYLFIKVTQTGNFSIVSFLVNETRFRISPFPLPGKKYETYSVHGSNRWS